MAPGRNRRVSIGDLPTCGRRIAADGLNPKIAQHEQMQRRVDALQSHVGENSYLVQCRAVQSYRHVTLPESSGGKTRAEISPAEQYPASATIVAN